MITALIAAAMAAAIPLPAGPAEPAAAIAQAKPRPAIWVVNDHDTIIFLFGTFHALDGRSDWVTQEIRTALSGADELILETLPPAPPKAAKRQDRKPSALTDRATGQAQSFLSTGKMIFSAGRSEGLSVRHGADTVLRIIAESDGKAVRGLESFEFQLGMMGALRSLSPPPARDPQEAEQRSAAVAALLLVLQDAWTRGDIDRFTPMLEDMRVRSPDAYKAMFADRNARWAGWIVNRLQQPGTVFVAVGAGHLTGRDSVQARLAEAGFRSARIN